MSERIHNLWLSDFINKVKAILTAYTDSNFPTYIVVGGNRIPLVLENVDVVEGVLPHSLELELKIANNKETKMP